MDRTSICNSALIEAEQDTTITSMDEASPSAERCRRIYDATRRELLAQYPWTFAQKLVKLARVSEDVEGYKYAYKYPTEALRINDIYLSEAMYRLRRGIVFDEADAKIGIVGDEKCVICDYEAPFISENIDVTDESLFPAHFTKLFYLTLASKIAKMAGATDQIKDRIAQNILTQESYCSTVTNRENSVAANDYNYYVEVRG